MSPRTRSLWVTLAAVLVLLSVFMLYLQPAFLVSLSDQLWACF